jgi:gamma-aminobutyric acid type B receptor
MFTKQHFPNFFRVVPSENAFNAPRLKLLQEFNWTRVGTIYQNEPRYSLVSSHILMLCDSNASLITICCHLPSVARKVIYFMP